jgi:hypothetical protein
MVVWVLFLGTFVFNQTRSTSALPATLHRMSNHFIYDSASLRCLLFQFEKFVSLDMVHRNKLLTTLFTEGKRRQLSTDYLVCGRPDCNQPSGQEEFFVERIVGRAAKLAGDGDTADQQSYFWLIKWDGYVEPFSLK